MEFTLQQIACALEIPLGQAPALSQVTGWSIDTRTIAPGDLFFALPGPNYDGAAFVREAFAKGAAAAIADRTAEGGPVLVVPDALCALQRLAAWARRRWAGDVIAITGSAGKTSTKEVVADLLSTAMKVGRTSGNFNNHIGVPLSLLRMPSDARAGVIEIGMNHAGEIEKLAAIAAPRVAVVTNVGHAHVENFENGIDGVAAAKRELVEALPPHGIAVLNADDPRVAGFRNAHGGRAVTFGIHEPADVRAEDLALHENGAQFRVGGVEFRTALSGRHEVLNILAGIAVTRIYGMETARLTDAVARLAPPRMRGERLRHRGILILNDCYNSNPDAARAMIDVLRDTPADRRIAVLGEMLELGRWSEDLHRELGRYVADSRISVLIGIRGAACHMVNAAVEAGLAKAAAYFFETPESAGDQLRGIAREGDAILFKGSRGARVEKALERFMA